MFGYNESSSYTMFDEQNEKFCENCNTSLSDLLSTGVVGCSNCYNTFQNEIRNYLINKQGAFNHVGKLAIRRVSKQKLDNEIKELEKQKQNAVDSENFILAESIKNRIEKLRGSL